MINGLLGITLVSFALTPLALTLTLLLGIWWVRRRSTLDGPERLLAAAVRLLPKERRDWGVAMLAELAQLQHPSTRWRFALGCSRVALIPPRKVGLLQSLMNDTIKNIATNPGAVALTGFILALPLPLLLLIALFEIEPLQSFLKPVFTAADGIRMSTFSKIFFLGSLLLLPVALIINLVPIVRNVRAGNSIEANSINLLLVLAISLFITGMVGVFVVDQYPCWMGIPNCD